MSERDIKASIAAIRFVLTNPDEKEDEKLVVIAESALLLLSLFLTDITNIAGSLEVLAREAIEARKEVGRKSGRIL